MENYDGQIPGVGAVEEVVSVGDADVPQSVFEPVVILYEIPYNPAVPVSFDPAETSFTAGDILEIGATATPGVTYGPEDLNAGLEVSELSSSSVIFDRPTQMNVNESIAVETNENETVSHSPPSANEPGLNSASEGETTIVAPSVNTMNDGEIVSSVPSHTALVSRPSFIDCRTRAAGLPVGAGVRQNDAVANFVPIVSVVDYDARGPRHEGSSYKVSWGDGRAGQCFFFLFFYHLFPLFN